MIKLNSKEKILAIFVGLLIMLFALKSFVFGPIYEKIAVYSRQIEQSKMAARKYQALEHNRTEILKAQKQIEGYSSLQGPEEVKSSMVMSKVEAEARKSKLQISDMNFVGSTKVKGGVTLYRVSLRAEGQLKNVLDFISGIEEANILLQAEKIVLSAKDDTGTLLKIDATILGVAFL